MMRAFTAFSRLHVKSQSSANSQQKFSTPRREFHRRCWGCHSGLHVETGKMPFAVHSCRSFSSPSSSVALDSGEISAANRRISKNQASNIDKWEKVTHDELKYKRSKLDLTHVQRSTERIFKHSKGNQPLQGGMVHEALQCIRLWSKMGSRDGAIKAAQILEMLIEHGQANDIEMYNGASMPVSAKVFQAVVRIFFILYCMLFGSFFKSDVPYVLCIVHLHGSYSPPSRSLQHGSLAGSRMLH